MTKGLQHERVLVQYDWLEFRHKLETAVLCEDTVAIGADLDTFKRSVHLPVLQATCEGLREGEDYYKEA